MNQILHRQLLISRYEEDFMCKKNFQRDLVIHKCVDPKALIRVNVVTESAQVLSEDFRPILHKQVMIFYFLNQQIHHDKFLLLITFCTLLLIQATEEPISSNTLLKDNKKISARVTNILINILWYFFNYHVNQYI